jgi:hypothetical protein
MVRRSFCALPLLAAACTAPRGPPPAPPAARPVPADLPARLRQAPWMARFWAELTPAQRRRVQARLRRADPGLATEEQAPRAWDALGLPERDALLFARVPPRLPPPAVPP